MKTLRVTSAFRDKENDKKLVSPPEEITVSNKRAKEILDAGVAEDITEEKKK